MFGQQLGFREGVTSDGLAFRPQGTEFGHVALNGAVDALLIESEELEAVAFDAPGAGVRGGFVFSRFFAVFSGPDFIAAQFALHAGGEDAGFDGADAFEEPVVLSDGMGEVDFQGVARRREPPERPLPAGLPAH